MRLSVGAWTILILSFVLAVSRSVRADLPLLKISENHRYIVTVDGKPFFYLGDTAWELIHRLDHTKAERYLMDRAARHFNVVQVAMIAEYDGLTVPDAEGHLPLTNNDPTKPNEDYFKDADWIINRAASLNLYVGLLPTWGDKVNKKWGIGPEIFTPQNAAVYGEFLGKRYKNKPIIWILGGDRPIETPQHMEVWRAMAAGISKGDVGMHLITYHPMGGRSSVEFVGVEPWLTFNMLQSGHGSKDIPVWSRIWSDYSKEPAKPTLDGEANYEDHPINWMPQNGYFTDFDVRKQAYWSVFAGACGYTYGCHDIWQFFEEGRTPISSARTPWEQALTLPGAGQMHPLIALMLSRPFETRVPDQSLIAQDNSEDGTHLQATRDADGSYAMIYDPNGITMKIDLRKLTGPTVKAWWFDPRSGSANPIGEFKNESVQEFVSPAAARPSDPNDWVLVIDNQVRHFPAPGTNP